MKTLILRNGKGKEYNLLDVAFSPTFQIDGLGFSDETEYFRVGNRFLPLEEMNGQGSIEMTLLFYNSSDVRYHDFVKFARHNPLVMIYENQKGMFYIPCRLISITKTDRKGYDAYACSVEFSLLGNPYEIRSSYNKGEIGIGKNYGLTGYQYDYTYANDILNTVIISSDSVVESSCIITIYGEVINPVWRHYVNGVLKESGAYNGTIDDGHYLVIDSVSFPYSIMEYNANGAIVADRYQLCNFSTERFMKVNEGENIYSISHDGTNAVKLKVEAHVEYEAV